MGKRVDVGAEGDGVVVVLSINPRDDAGSAGKALAMLNACIGQFVADGGASARLFVAQLGVGVEVVANCEETVAFVGRNLESVGHAQRVAMSKS